MPFYISVLNHVVGGEIISWYAVHITSVLNQVVGYETEWGLYRLVSSVLIYYKFTLK
jgi:hypothetical protein